MGTETKGSRLKLARDSLLNKSILPVSSPLVLEAFRKVDRHIFVPRGYKSLAYKDTIVPLGEGSSISQPMLVAEMIDLAHLTGIERVLEIGTASGYAAAVLSHLATEVHTVEYDEKLAKKAKKKLTKLGYDNVKVYHGDGALGLPSEAPFDAIIVTAAAREIPKSLEEQLAEGGRIVIPIGRNHNNAKLILGLKYHGNILTKTMFTGITFVPLMSREQGGWTEEAIQHLVGLKRKALKKLVEKEIGKELEDEELKKIIAQKTGQQPKDIDLDFIARVLRVPDEALEFLE